MPILTALSFLTTVECNMQEGMEGNPAAGTMKNVSRVLAVLAVPFYHGISKGYILLVDYIKFIFTWVRIRA
ncbi:hypothetical protein QN277_016309 [Acacia crassicarpa]|uniref:Uncharacterized protein n=1 Tax=Acacia crassicarpa TaxID=499986 RepID=A0AAE1MWC6_9FABA|nr:hypothetical protein QN277_016309 [Acacia crassicarpa]